MTVGIVGLGLIGGSMAKSIKTRTDHRVLGADIDAETMLLARLSGAVDGELNGETLGGCDLIFLALRPAAAVR
ncbi:MAG: prephenate dehydrogenase/arogenate dehydrogenase family protein, partial [Oscillospiraceae bacterium]|nr:prephenate dehydrogenase/arogenate dehydrogenase family protein [Oscillospiraceae bacterium]